MAASARRSAQMLIAQGIPVTLIDTDIEMIDVAGELRRQGLLRRRHAARPAAPGRRGRGRADPVLHRRRPDRRRAARGGARGLPEGGDLRPRLSTAARLLKLKGAPVAGVVREVLESAVKMARLAMQTRRRRRGGDRPDRGPLPPPRPRAAEGPARERRSARQGKLGRGRPGDHPGNGERGRRQEPGAGR